MTWIYLPLSTLRKHPKNYRVGDIDGIIKSIIRFGFNGDLRVREGLIIAGNQSFTALARMKDEGKPAPNRIQVEDNEWLIHCIDLSHLSETDALAYLVADNKTQESGTIEDAALLSILQEVKALDRSAFEATGFDDKGINFLIASQRRREVREETADPKQLQERSAELGRKWKTESGQLWKAAEHRLFVGDSTNAEHVKRLLAGCKPAIMVTDPPYGVDYDASWRLQIDDNAKSVGKVTNDDNASWRAAYQHSGAAIAYVWHASLNVVQVVNDLTACGYELRSMIIWLKNEHIISRGHYHWRHEPCIYAVMKGATASWQGDHKQNTVWEINARLSEAQNKEEDKFYSGHGTQKPVEIYTRAYTNHLIAGDIAYDPFAGSGSCFIAAEKMGAIQYGMELSPEYAGSILERLSLFGLTPVLS